MNSNYEILDDGVLVKINSKMYSKEILLHASYVLLDKFYFLLDIKGDYFEVFIKSREDTLKEDLIEECVMLFLDELIESAAYIDQLKRTSGIRESILESALFSQKNLDELNQEELKENKI